MEVVTTSVILWGVADASNPWAVLGVIATALATIAGVVLSVAAYRSKREADRGQQEIEGVKASISSLEAALARADIDRARSDATAERLAGELATTRTDLAEAWTQIDHLRRDMAAERRHHADRVKVLVRQLERLGAHPEGDPDDR